MLYLLYEFYRKQLSTYNLVMRHLKLRLALLLSIPFIFMFASLFTFYKYKNVFIALLPIIPTIALFALLYFAVNNKAKSVVKKIYNISSEDHEWNSPKVLIALRRYEKDRLCTELKQVDPCSDEHDIKELSEAAKNESEKIKFKFPVIPSFIAALFISLWNNFFNWVYRSDDIKTINDAVLIFLIPLLLLISIISFYMMISPFLNLVKEDLFNREEKKMREFSEILNEIYKDKQKQKKSKLINTL